MLDVLKRRLNRLRWTVPIGVIVGLMFALVSNKGPLFLPPTLGFYVAAGWAGYSFLLRRRSLAGRRAITAALLFAATTVTGYAMKLPLWAALPLGALSGAAVACRQLVSFVLRNRRVLGLAWCRFKLEPYSDVVAGLRTMREGLTEDDERVLRRVSLRYASLVGIRQIHHLIADVVLRFVCYVPPVVLFVVAAGYYGFFTSKSPIPFYALGIVFAILGVLWLLARLGLPDLLHAVFLAGAGTVLLFRDLSVNGLPLSIDSVLNVAVDRNLFERHPLTGAAITIFAAAAAMPFLYLVEFLRGALDNLFFKRVAREYVTTFLAAVAGGLEVDRAVGRENQHNIVSLLGTAAHIVRSGKLASHIHASPLQSEITRRRYGEMANAILAWQQEAIFADRITRPAFQRDVASGARALALGWDGEFPRVPHEDVPKRARRAAVIHIARNVVVGAIPFAATFIALKVGVQLAPEIQGAVWTFSVAWAGVSLLILVDPQLEKRAKATSSIAGLLRGQSKDEGKK